MAIKKEVRLSINKLIFIGIIIVIVIGFIGYGSFLAGKKSTIYEKQNNTQSVEKR